LLIELNKVKGKRLKAGKPGGLEAVKLIEALPGL